MSTSTIYSPSIASILLLLITLITLSSSTSNHSNYPSSLHEFQKLCNSFNTDKCNRHIYHVAYYSYFKPLFNENSDMNVGSITSNRTEVEDQTIRMLEIGLDAGGSLKLWTSLFKNKKFEIHVLDNNITAINDFLENALEFNNSLPSNVKYYLHHGDQADADILINLLVKIGMKKPGFDIIIDDGGHLVHEQLNSFIILFSSLKPNGLYFIEDLYTSYSPYYASKTFTTITEFKKLLKYIHGLPIPADEDFVLLPMIQYISSLDFYEELVVISKHSKEYLAFNFTSEQFNIENSTNSNNTFELRGRVPTDFQSNFFLNRCHYHKAAYCNLLSYQLMYEKYLTSFVNNKPNVLLLGIGCGADSVGSEANLWMSMLPNATFHVADEMPCLKLWKDSNYFTRENLAVHIRTEESDPLFNQRLFLELLLSNEKFDIIVDPNGEINRLSLFHLLKLNGLFFLQNTFNPIASVPIVEHLGLMIEWINKFPYGTHEDLLKANPILDNAMSIIEHMEHIAGMVVFKKKNLDLVMQFNFKSSNDTKINTNTNKTVEKVDINPTVEKVVIDKKSDL